MAEGTGTKTYAHPEGLQPAPGSPGASAGGPPGSAVEDIPMMAPTPSAPWWKPVLVIAGSLALGWAGWRLWTTGDPRALLPWPSSAGQRVAGGGPFGGAAARRGLMPGPDYGDDCGCGG